MSEQQNSIDLALDFAQSAGGAKLAEGIWPAVCVGLTVTEMKKFESEELEPKLQLIFQIHGETHVDEESDEDSKPVVLHLRTRPFALKTNAKSALCKFLMAWSKSTTPEEMAKKLSGGETTRLDLGLLVGKQARLTIKHDAKGYAEIVDIAIQTKKTLIEKLDPEASVPAYLHSPKSPLLQSKWIKGIELAPAKGAEAEAEEEAEEMDLAAVAESILGENEEVW